MYIYIYLFIYLYVYILVYIYIYIYRELDWSHKPPGCSITTSIALSSLWVLKSLYMECGFKKLWENLLCTTEAIECVSILANSRKIMEYAEVQKRQRKQMKIIGIKKLCIRVCFGVWWNIRNVFRYFNIDDVLIR